MKESKKTLMGIIAVLVLMLVSITRRLPEARRLSPGITTLTLVGIVLLVAAGSASADTEIDVTTFGGGDYDANIANERYYLTADLTADADKSGIIIGADGVTIDGQGHYISGGTPGSCSPGIATLPGAKGGKWARPGILVGDLFGDWELATIKNIEVKNFCTGILLYGYADTKNERHIVENCSVHDNGNPEVHVSEANMQGLALYTKVCNCTINNNTVYNNCGELKPSAGDCDDNGAGISLKVSSNDNDITNNTCYNNTLAGIYSKAGGGNCYNRIFNNTVYENGAIGATATYTGGIRFQCKSTDWNTFENNTARDNFGPGIFIGGHNCTLRNNTATDNKNADAGNPGYGLWNGRWDGGGGGDSHTQSYDNTFCDNEDDDIHVDNLGQNVTGDNNTCYTTSNYGDTGTGAGECTYRCFTVDGHCSPVNDGLAVDITNLETGDKWDAKIDATNDDYSLLLKGEWDSTATESADIRADETLRIHACDNISSNERACNVTDHDVTSGEITAGGFTEDLALNHFCRNYLTFPYRTWEESNWSGPAVLEMLIDHYRDPPDVPDQTELNETGIGYNQGCNANLPYADPRGMKYTLNQYLHAYNGLPYVANYGIGDYDDIDDVLHYMCKWHYLGPGAAPVYGNYSNWMAVRGIHTDVKPTFTQGSYTIYGFWMNDPYNELLEGPGGIGENTYKSVEQWTSTYHLKLNKSDVDPTDTYYDKYVAVCEPPEDDNVEVTLAKPKPRLADAIRPALTEKTLAVYDTRQPVLEMVVKDEELLKIIEAAIDGVTEELLSYDVGFADVFAKTTAGNPVFVAAEAGDYYLVPFNARAVEISSVNKVPAGIKKSGITSLKEIEYVDEETLAKPMPIEPIKIEKTLVVVLVDGEDGSFKEASWVADPVKYLPVSKAEALKLALSEMDITDKDSIRSLKSKPTIEIVYRDASPYYPDWKTTVGDEVYFVGQDGTVSQG